MGTLAKGSSFPSLPKVILTDDLEIPGHWKLIEPPTIITSTTLDLQQIIHQIKVFIKVVVVMQQRDFNSGVLYAKFFSLIFSLVLIFY